MKHGHGQVKKNKKILDDDVETETKLTSKKVVKYEVIVQYRKKEQEQEELEPLPSVAEL